MAKKKTDGGPEQNGGSLGFNNSGFNSLPLYVQQKIMRNSNKKEVGGLNTVDPKQVEAIMQSLAAPTRADMDKTSAEVLYQPGSPEYQQALQSELNNILALNPTDTYTTIDNTGYSAENYYAALKANPPAFYYNILGETGKPRASFNIPTLSPNQQFVQMSAPTGNTLAPKAEPGVRSAGTQERREDRPLMYPGQQVDYTYKQYMEESANDPAKIAAKKELEETMDINRDVLKTLTPEQQAEARKLGLTANEYLNQRTFGTKEGMSFANGGNMYPNGSTLGPHDNPLKGRL
jgi:hypothetical protein